MAWRVESQRRVGGADEAHERHEQNGCIERVGAFVLNKGFQVITPEIGKDIFIDGVADFTPLLNRRGERTLAGEADGSVEGDPAHEAGVKEFTATSTDFPIALVRTIPVFGEPVEDALEVVPAVVGDAVTVLGREVDGIDEFAVDIKLELLVGTVADADGM